MSTGSSDGGHLRRSLELMWGTPEEPTRGPKPALSVDRIVSAAIEAADRDGLAALSMRRLATQLGVGAMSLYRYVPGKRELIDLMVDEVFGEDLEKAEAADGNWRERWAEFGRQLWALYQRHPWLQHIDQGRPMLGPNAMASTEIWLRAVDGIGLDEHEMLSTVVLVTSYIAGLARVTIDAMQAAERTGISDEEWWKVQEEYIGPVVASGKLPMLEKLGEADAFGSMFDSFEFGLERVLDGLEVLINSRR
jgi:AcrR family transcriptional regulator